MKTSVRRQCLRLQLGVKRKLVAVRWNDALTARVRFARLGQSRSQHYVKANEGVEKSCTRKVRRKRGLRKGKGRSRVGKTRPIPARPAPDSKTESVRVLVHNERMFAAARRARDGLLAKSKHSLLRRTTGDDVVRERLRQAWYSCSAGFPKNVRMLYFGNSFSQFLSLAQMAVDNHVLDRPPLPPRPRGMVNGRSVEDSQGLARGPSFSISHQHPGQSDGLGPDPCGWCTKEWREDGELGMDHAKCLRIQFCVRNPAVHQRVEKGAKLHRSNVVSRGKRVKRK